MSLSARVSINYEKDESGAPPGEQQAQEACAFCGWAFETTQGDNRLARRLLSGRWDGRFLVCPPGCRVERDWDGGIFRAGGRQENEGDSKPEVVEVGQ